LEISLDLFRKSLAMNGDYEKARNWVDKVGKEIAEKRISNSSNSEVTSTAAASIVTEIVKSLAGSSSVDTVISSLETANISSPQDDHAQ
jgi:hypothetical protein